ncbi:MAG: hypothetical protein EOP56_18865 [Sphingobacteriales bacterium]|nr:MAG: hypothetical protein EOP56_18865 [Sphingobacteriales bacterium]
MQLTGTILILASCLLITYQDFKARLIHLACFLILGTGIILFILPSFLFLYPLYILNLVFCLLLISILKLYIRIRRGRNENLINKYLGSGDVLMLAMLCFFFTPSTYILFVLVSCMTGIIYFLLARSAVAKQVQIPLAGIMTSLLILILGHSLLFSYDVSTIEIFNHFV